MVETSVPSSPVRLHAEALNDLSIGMPLPLSISELRLTSFFWIHLFVINLTMLSRNQSYMR
jgi:hypothetical protein